MMADKALTRIEQSIEIDCAPEAIYDLLIDCNNIPVYAAGIEGAEIIEEPNPGMVGARIEMVTKAGNILHATVLEAERPHRLVIEDERRFRSTWTIEPVGDRVRLLNVLEGPMPAAKAERIRFDADVKFQALAARLDRK